jgi:(E)-4-hydroxy-3-methylbut-2-enyl-diphosphate synthase
MIVRRRTRQVRIGSVLIGGDAPISVQSMTTTRTENVEETVAQIERLEEAGCELVRVAVPDDRALEVLPEIKGRIRIPLIADIHYNYRFALSAIDKGIDKIRINPGNIGGPKRFREVIVKAREHGVPMRIGVNAGSLDKKHIGAARTLEDSLVASALEYLKVAEDLDYQQIVLSVKSSSVPTTVDAYRKLSGAVDYPLHIGVTEAGTLLRGTVKSCVGLGILLSEGIGDTLRVSLTADPVEEVKVGFATLSALDLRHRGIDLVSCPTCSRCDIDIIPLVEEVERRLSHFRVPIKVAVMGCEVNGPGEAREADIGIAAGRKEGLLFKKGKIMGKLPPEKWVEVLVGEVEKMVRDSEDVRRGT